VLTIGLMSGTSLDGIDGVLVDWDSPPAAVPTGPTPPTPAAHPRTLAFAHAAFAPALRAELLALNRPGDDELHRAALAANALAEAYAAVVARLLQASGRGADEVAAVGAHGQTVRHRPGEFDGSGYTVQLLNAALLAERCGIDVVADLRSADVAAGGQGAPLVPAFHARIFATPGEDVAVLNLGGIANLTLLPAGGAVNGFDCGPANVLMDGWCQQHLGQPFDRDGAWAAGGRIDAALLARCLQEPFFDRAPPKSTGRDLFDADWLAQRLALQPAGPGAAAIDPVDVMATLCELTAVAAAQALRRHQPDTRRLHVCGGGALNAHLMRRLQAHLADVDVASTAVLGWPPEHVEALAFAWLARSRLARQPGNLPMVTGARGPRVLGALHAAAGEAPAAGKRSD
jgi:anhydro-N-acetylmuramic acid kinase